MKTIDILTENTEIILPEKGLEQKLAQAAKENRKLRIKLGFDPTAPDLHLGHAVVLKKLRQFQELGHQVLILVGSFTARIGDPTGKSKSRKPLSAEEVGKNAETYIRQLSKIIDVDKAEIVFNSDWLDALPFAEVIQLLSGVTVAQLMQRHDFGNRFRNQIPIAMHELVYPVLQGFDSVKINCDIEMGGSDQLFNCTMGRHLQEASGLPGQIVLCMPLLRGTDGQEKMSKSLNNTIGLTDTPNEMFGKTMSIPDQLIPEFIALTTDLDAAGKLALHERLAQGENPMKIKKLIAKNIIAQYHSAVEAEEAEAFFVKQFQLKQAEEKQFVPVPLASLPTGEPSLSLPELCVLLKPELSRSAARRLIAEGAVQLDHQKVTDVHHHVVLSAHTKIRIGKLVFFELL